MSATVPDGFFIWHELRTGDPERAADFYAAVFGWTYTQHEMPGGLLFWEAEVGNRQIGGIMSFELIGMPADSHPHWASVAHVADVDAITARAVELGGSLLMGPQDEAGFGRWAALADPQGAMFLAASIVYPAPDPAADIPAGGIVWHELLTTDVPAATEFYTKLFGYSAEVSDEEAYGGYTVLSFEHNGAQIRAGGIGPKEEDMPQPAWGVYIRTDEIEETRRLIEARGGENHTDAFDVPAAGTLSVAVDPTGTFFSLLQPAPR